MRVRLSAGRSTPAHASGVVWAGARAAAVDAALTAAGSPGLLPTYDMLWGSHADRLFKQAVIDSGFATMDKASWPHDGGVFVSGVKGEVFREGSSAVYRLPDGTLAYLVVRDGWASCSVAGVSSDPVGSALSMFQTLYPATYLDATDDRVPVTFWSLGPHGPEPRLRMIDASPWETIRRNYSASVRENLDATMTAFEPGKGGLLLLWQGPPGTGKTWALRALVSEWLPWAEFHYITDPDAFFVESASYMIDVLLADSYEAIHEPSGDIYSEDAADKWRVLILEDTGELLSANAKEKYGQGLSRLLNVVDGLIGQGLRVLVLVTTNDELGELNPAVRRPGRCASQVEFVPMTAEEVAEWLGAQEAEAGTTLAELYSRATVEPVEPLAGESLEAGGVIRDSVLTPIMDARMHHDGTWEVWEVKPPDDVKAEIRRVAAEHAPDGYGETAYHSADRAVFWVSADWTTPEEHAAAEADFRAIDGVDDFQHDAEAALPDGDGWEQVWPDPDSDLALERVVQLAARPLETDS